jgi:hypothetical protein
MNHNDHIILDASIAMLTVFILNRIFNATTEYIRSDLWRRHKLYAKLFRLPIVLLAIAIVLWVANPDLSSIRIELLAGILGVGISIAFAESYKRLSEHKRIKRTFGFLKYVTVPYLDSHADSILGTLKNYEGELSLPHALVFLNLVANLDSINESFDMSWLQLVHSQDFIDAIDNDNQFQGIADIEFEVLSFTKCLATHVVKARYWISGIPLLNDEQRAEAVKDINDMRDELKNSAASLKTYSQKLDTMMSEFLFSNGAEKEPV